jgi:hypothetical protein
MTTPPSPWDNPRNRQAPLKSICYPHFLPGRSYIDNDNIAPSPFKVTFLDRSIPVFVVRFEEHEQRYELLFNPLRGEYFTHPLFGNVYASNEYC